MIPGTNGFSFQVPVCPPTAQTPTGLATSAAGPATAAASTPPSAPPFSKSHLDPDQSSPGEDSSAGSAYLSPTSSEGSTNNGSTNNDPSLDFTWPNGDCEFIVPHKSQTKEGVPYFGWYFHFTNSRRLASGQWLRTGYCIGVMVCPHPNCPFKQRPMRPVKNRMGEPPKLPCKSTCPDHPKATLKWIPCTGGNPSALPKSNLETIPCVVKTYHTPGDKSVNVHHYGNHNHVRPIVTKASPAAMRQLETLVINNTKLGPAKLKAGDVGRPPASDIDPSFGNIDRLKYHRKNILGRTSGSAGIGDLMQMVGNDIEEPFIIHMEVSDPTCQIITMQSQYMKDVLAEGFSALQSDTVEGVLFEPNYDGFVDLHFTSGYDYVLMRWVPVLVSVIFKRTTEHYSQHCRALFESYPSGGGWKEFEKIFKGVGIDWSTALGDAFRMELCQHANQLGHNLDDEGTSSFISRCDVHFKRSYTRIARNGNVVKADQREEFKKLVNALRKSKKASFSSFREAVKAPVRKFPKAANWIKWYLHPNRASSYFPAACQQFSQSELSRFQLIDKSTNAQENLGKQWQDRFIGHKNEKLSVFQAVLATWKFVKSFQLDRQLTREGMPTHYCGLPKTPSPQNRKRGRAKNDGRAPDTNS